jgi:ferredoxin
VLAEVEASAGDVLLDVARLADVPLHWRCGQGTCGTCKVRIRHAGPAQVVMLGRKERNVLLRAGLIDASAGCTGKLAGYFTAGGWPAMCRWASRTGWWCARRTELPLPMINGGT